MLADLGARVYGFALAPERDALFELSGLRHRLAAHTVGDLRDAAAVEAAMRAARPEIVLHLAAQPLVRASYAAPVETYAVNILGTVHLLEAVRNTGSVGAVVVVTSDKCYDQRGGSRAFHENDPLGGTDPYSSSKAAAELVTAAYRESFLRAAGVGVATVRAGNVIGGGDRAADRLLPDVFRALDGSDELVVRYPGAVRPWQHVLDPLAGYLALAERLPEDSSAAGPWNFGPADADARPVDWILQHIAARVPGLRWRVDPGSQLHETAVLRLDSARARAQLGWVPRWDLGTALDRTLDWHRDWRAGGDAAALCRRQIVEHAAARMTGTTA